MEVEIWSDVACPWCYLGKRRLRRRSPSFERRDEVTSPGAASSSIPPRRARRGSTRRAPRAEYGMTPRRGARSQRRLAGSPPAEGLEMHLDRRAAATPSTPTACAPRGRAGVRDAVKERLMRAYHCEGEPAATRRRSTRLATEAGLDADEVARCSRASASPPRSARTSGGRVARHRRRALLRRRSRFAASGAQSPAILGELLRHASQAPPAPVGRPLGVLTARWGRPTSLGRT